MWMLQCEGNRSLRQTLHCGLLSIALAGCGSSTQDLITTPPPRPVTSIELHLQTAGLTMWPIGQALELTVHAFDQRGYPTVGTPQFTVTKGGGMLSMNPPASNSVKGLISWGAWKLGAEPAVNAFRTTLAPGIDTTIDLEAVIAAPAPAGPTRYTLESIDGRRPPYYYEQDSVYVYSLELELHGQKYLISARKRHPNSPDTITDTEGGSVSWGHGVANLKADAEPGWEGEDHLLVAANDGRLQIASSRGVGVLWPPLGVRHDFRRVP